MNKEQTVIQTGGVSASTLLGVLFVGLKLGGIITWPWLWVLSPFWIPVALLLVIVLVAFLVGMLAWIFNK